MIYLSIYTSFTKRVIILKPITSWHVNTLDDTTNDTPFAILQC